VKKMITIEPIMDFNLDRFSQMLIEAAPARVNIGADSGRNGLPEPSCYFGEYCRRQNV
jgi:hypothetical protein